VQKKVSSEGGRPRRGGEPEKPFGILDDYWGGERCVNKDKTKAGRGQTRKGVQYQGKLSFAVDRKKSKKPPVPSTVKEKKAPWVRGVLTGLGKRKKRKGQGR